MPIQDRSQRRQRVLRAQAIVLRHRNWGEADRILGLFTLEMGKVQAIAKGVRRPRSRKAGHLEPFTHVKLLLARGRNIAIITQAEAIDQFTTLREDMLLTTYASYVVELLDRFTYEEGENRQLFRLLRNTLARLCSADKPELVLRYYETWSDFDRSCTPVWVVKLKSNPRTSSSPPREAGCCVQAVGRALRGQNRSR